MLQLGHVANELNKFIELRRRIQEEYPDLDDQTLADTLEGATNLKEAISALIRSALEDEALVEGLKGRVEVMRSRLARLEDRAANKRLLALDGLTGWGQQKLVDPEFTASIRTIPPNANILDPDLLPLEFLVPQPPKPDRRAILEALKDGKTVPGAALNPPKLSLSVRSQ